MNWRRQICKKPYLIAAIPADRSGSSILIYLAAQMPEDMLIYEFEHSKLYRHDLNSMAEKMNVSQVSLWIGSKDLAREITRINRGLA